MLTPVWMVLHWAIIASTWTQRNIVWAGIHYEILSKEKTKVLGRADQIVPLPVGAPGLPFLLALADKAATGPVIPRPQTAVMPATVGIEAVAPVPSEATFVQPPVAEILPEAVPPVAAEIVETVEPLAAALAETEETVTPPSIAEPPVPAAVAEAVILSPELPSVDRYAAYSLALWATPDIMDTAPSLQLWSRETRLDPGRFLVSSRKGERAHPLNARPAGLRPKASSNPKPVSYHTTLPPVAASPSPKLTPTLPAPGETPLPPASNLGAFLDIPRSLSSRRPQRGVTIAPQLPSLALSSRPNPPAKGSPPGEVIYRVARPTSRKPSARP